mmetsp:Transcript_92003/g.269151  ORF Transcript_92003/g.269151 Transcript_92003/m.269151 type:complete len:291 (+) Transcript_92003:1010-1882(+)
MTVFEPCRTTPDPRRRRRCRGERRRPPAAKRRPIPSPPLCLLKPVAWLSEALARLLVGLVLDLKRDFVSGKATTKVGAESSCLEARRSTMTILRSDGSSRGPSRYSPMVSHMLGPSSISSSMTQTSSRFSSTLVSYTFFMSRWWNAAISSESTRYLAESCSDPSAASSGLSMMGSSRGMPWSFSSVSRRNMYTIGMALGMSTSRISLSLMPSSIFTSARRLFSWPKTMTRLPCCRLGNSVFSQYGRSRSCVIFKDSPWGRSSGGGSGRGSKRPSAESAVTFERKASVSFW